VEAKLEDVLRNWTAPNVNLAQDSCLSFDQAGRLIAYMRLEHTRYTKFSVYVRVQPDYSEASLSEHLFELAEAWARERMVQAEPDVRVTLGSWLPESDEVGHQLIKRAGLREIRRYWDMEIEMNEAPPAPIWPEGIELRPYVPERDERLVFDLIDEAFLDHWGHIPGRFEEFRHWTIERENFDPSLWFIAYDGEQAVGGALCIDEDEHGWVDDLAVLRPARGKGLGAALLFHAFGEFYRRGQRKVGLGVDSQNFTGALRLYERAGMKKIKENISYEKELRAGVELSTRELRD
jgi:GNAT superfamily N-acetyltransferase